MSSGHDKAPSLQGEGSIQTGTLIPEQTAPANEDDESRNSLRTRPYHGNKEALGWALDGVARVVSFTAPAVFLSVAIINLAKREVGCETKIPPGEIKAPECNETVYGIRPSSLLTTYGTIVGLISACSLPLVGAVVDYTSQRKLIGFCTAIIQIGLTFGQIFISKSNWFAMTVALVFNAFVGWVHTLAAFAYLPELTEDSNLLVSWTASFHILQYVSVILFMVYMLGMIQAFGFDGDDVLLDDLPAARLACASALVVSVPCYLWTWTSLMKQRDASHALPEGSSLSTIGFVKVLKTSKQLLTKYRALMWFFVNVSLVEACQSNLAIIGLTYMTDTLLMTVNESGIAILALFLFGIVGSIVGKYSVSCMNPIRSNMLCQVFTGIITGVAALIVTGPGQQMRAYVMAAGWGVGVGWKNVVERFALCKIIPKGQHTELMGFYLFSSQVLAWLPTLIFTVMNEAGISQRLGLLMLIAFFGGGMLALSMMGSYDEAVHLAEIESDAVVNDDDVVSIVFHDISHNNLQEVSKDEQISC